MITRETAVASKTTTNPRIDSTVTSLFFAKKSRNVRFLSTLIRNFSYQKTLRSSFYSEYSTKRWNIEEGALRFRKRRVKKSNIGYAEIGGCSANLKFEWNSPNRLERLWSGTRYPYRSTRSEDRIERRIVSSNERNHRSLIARLLKYYLILARSEHLAIVQRNLHRLLLSFSFPLPLSLSSIETRSSISPFPS